ncbi:hypothetical protein [Paenibacillus thailandensis]|uniref:Uncharacterized protein n=1 Tax=Paenibacillus thailandensis TaxID=393250 RepID=A0ABW5R3M7_9BACL
MKIPFTIRQLIWLIVWIIISAFLVTGFTLSIIAFAGTGKDWASALIQAMGGIIGGIIGGIVAIIVAAYQITRTFANERNKQRRTSCTMLKLIREELRDNITTVESAVPYKAENFRILKTQLSEDTWRSSMVYLDISDQLLVKLNVAYRKIALIKNLDATDVTSELLTETKDQLNTILNVLNSEIGNSADLELD